MADKSALTQYLDQLHQVVFWKLEGLSERQLRQPMTPTGSNLLGIVKHLGTVEFSYFGLVFHRPVDEPMPWSEVRDNSDMYATEEQDSTWVKGFYRRANVLTATTIEELDLDTKGEVPWWPTERRHPTLERVAIHMINETARHTGHMDIIRELLDGASGASQANSNLPPQDAAWWAAYREKLQHLANQA